MKFMTLLGLLLVSLLTHAQELASANPSLLFTEANQSLADGDTKHAEGIFKQVIEFYEQEGRVKEVSENYLGMAMAFAFSGHYAESIRFHKKALKAHHRYRPTEDDDAIRFNLGLTYLLAGKQRKAKRLLE